MGAAIYLFAQGGETASAGPAITTAPAPTTSEQLKFNKAQLAKMETFRKCKQACINALRQMPDHYPEEPFLYKHSQSCKTLKRPWRQRSKETFTRSRLTGDFLKLYTDSFEERRLVVQLLKKLKFQFYTIKAKAEHPIKVVIKGLPRTTNPEEIKQDLELLGFTPERVNQLIGRKTKRALSIFLITLPRNSDNLKIFDLKTFSYLSIRVEGYDGKGVTQCCACNNFNHSSENCHLYSRCLKCDENHITRDCPIKQKLETAYCINCQVYGHMSNYRGCPSFPKPPQGAAKNNRNSYTNIYNNLVRPNISFAQATNRAISTKKNPQMATRGPGFSAQTEAKKPNPPSNRYSNNNFQNFNHRNNNFNFNNSNNDNALPHAAVANPLQ
ncbi:uncharacterized protein TNCV_1136191 [Trichonephila clavipes]|nr:uncharacterized protein TNCV_1136191 [Trichonephila clavipes]